MKLAKHGLGELEGNVDTLIVVPNEVPPPFPFLPSSLPSYRRLFNVML
jgi:hypothetical protein